MRTLHNYVSFRFYDCTFFVSDIMKTTWLLLLFEKKPTSLSKVADMFRQSSVPIETPDLDSRL